MSYQQLAVVSKRLDKTGGPRRLLEDGYWRGMYAFTRFLEIIGYPRRVGIGGDAVLNFGCGVHMTSALNSDLFAVHRFLKGRPRPDIYLSGAAVPSSLRARFDGIICEHVLEHVSPLHARLILGNLLAMLKPGGMIQISVPSVSRLINCSGNRVEIDILSVNDMAYNYGHRFLHDEHSIAALASDAGFAAVEVNSYATSPWREHLVAEREPESIYLIARRPDAPPSK